MVSAWLALRHRSISSTWAFGDVAEKKKNHTFRIVVEACTTAVVLPVMHLKDRVFRELPTGWLLCCELRRYNFLDFTSTVIITAFLNGGGTHHTINFLHIVMKSGAVRVSCTLCPAHHAFMRAYALIYTKSTSFCTYFLGFNITEPCFVYTGAASGRQALLLHSCQTRARKNYYHDVGITNYILMAVFASNKLV